MVQVVYWVDAKNRTRSLFRIKNRAEAMYKIVTDKKYVIWVWLN